MKTPGACRAEIQTDGVVHAVDTVNRELSVAVSGSLVNFDVPPDCVVVLRGEPVKLRLIQPGDLVRVTSAEVHSSPVAGSWKSRPDTSSAGDYGSSGSSRAPRASACAATTGRTTPGSSPSTR
jgi:hypothetical protein